MRCVEQIMSEIDASNLPREVLEKTLKLKNATRLIYIKLYLCGKPMKPKTLAEMLGYTRAYVHMRLRQLELMSLAKSSREGRQILFEVKK
jgi:DNA-binding MarR family transcriptional regulator